MKTHVTIVEDMYRAEIWEDTQFDHAFFVVISVKIDNSYKEKHTECASLPEALRILAGFIEEV